MYVQTLLQRVNLLQGTQTFHFLTRHDELQATPKSQDSHVSNFIGSDQKVAPYLLVGFEVMTPKSDFLIVENRTITPKGSINTANLGKTSLFIE